MRSWLRSCCHGISPIPPDPEALRAFCHERLSRHKAPSLWFIVDHLPLTPTGKVQKFVLQERIENGTLTPLLPQ